MTMITVRNVAVLTVVLGLVLWLGWVGHEASDDRAYISMAEAWLGNFPAVPGSHWAVRHPLILPISASFYLFGPGEVQSILPVLLYGLALIVLIYAGTVRVFGQRPAMLVTLLLLLTPLVTERMTVAGVDIVEAFYVFASLGCFLIAADRQGAAAWLLLAGLCAGLAYLSRETSVALIVFYGLSFLIRPPVIRWRYFIMAVGFCLIIGGEMIYYALVADNALLRFEIVLGMSGDSGAGVPGTGNVLDNHWLSPVVALLINNEFGGLFWLAGAAGVWLWRNSAAFTPTQYRFLVSVVGLGIIWFIIVGYVIGLRALPRYFFVPTVAAVGLAGVWLWQLVCAGRAAMTGGLLFLFTATSLLLIDLSNQQLLLPERTVVRLLAADAERPVYTDPRTAWRAEKLVDWARLSGSKNLIAAPPSPGGLFVYNASGVNFGYAGPHGRFDRAVFRPSADWQEVELIRGESTLIGRLIMTLGLEEFVHGIGLSRLVWETPMVVVYRRPATDP